MSAGRIFRVPPHRLSVGERQWLRARPSVADQYQALWRVVIF